MRRLISSTASEILNMTKDEKLLAIQMSEGRTIMSECTTSGEPDALSNASLPELYAAFGADCIMLNVFDVFNPHVTQLNIEDKNETIRVLKKYTGKLVGTNLEAVPEQIDIPVELNKPVAGRISSEETILRCKELGFDFICLTGNPNTGVTNKEIMNQVRLAKKLVGDDIFIVAGKMHAAGSLKEAGTKIVTKEIIKDYQEAGVDVVIVPTPGTVPGFTLDYSHELVQYAQSLGLLAMASVGTSQEDADTQSMRQFALTAKMMGADLHHLGDAGYAGATPESTMAYSIAMRGKRHTYNRMATSPLR